MVYAPTKQTTLIVDREQAKAQLQLLGYQPGDSVYMRFFVPNDDPRYGTAEAARKASKLNWEKVERYQNQGYGVYFVINGGGHTDEEVEVGHIKQPVFSRRISVKMKKHYFSNLG